MSETTPILISVFELLLSEFLPFTSTRISRAQRKRQRLEVSCVRLTFRLCMTDRRLLW